VRLVPRIGFLGIALVAVVATLAGCGGGSGGTTARSRTTTRSHATTRTQAPARKSSPKPPTVVAHRAGPPRVEPGEQALPASPCQAYGKNGTTILYVYPDSPGCARVAPGERLRVANYTGIGNPAEAVAVRVRVGDYEMRLGPHQEGVIRAPDQTYLGRGTHSVEAIGGLGPTVLFLPRVCAIRPPAKRGEELCFRER
jgi:hypothetical protein